MTQNTVAQLATRETRADCKVRSNRNNHRTHQFRSVIDHIVDSNSLNASPAKQKVFETQDVLDYNPRTIAQCQRPSTIRYRCKKRLTGFQIKAHQPLKCSYKAYSISDRFNASKFCSFDLPTTFPPACLL